MKFIIGITGGSGSGKTTVTSYLKEKGAFVIDADIVAREIVSPGKPALLEIREAFSDVVILPDGSLDRKMLGNIVFSDSEKLNILNNITHKYIVEDIKAKAKENGGFIVIDAALLFQTELDLLCDKTLLVTADKTKRKDRIIKRDNLTEDLAQNRISSQEDYEMYKEKADFHLENCGTLEDLKNKTDLIVKEIM